MGYHWFESNTFRMNTKQCNRCYVEKPITEFSFRHTARNIRRHDCKTCCAVVSHNHYVADPEKVYQRHVVKRRKLRAWVTEQKNKPCLDCNKMFETFFMHFDHLPKHDKVAKISDIVADGRSMAMIQAEIDKCELVCSDCHTVRTVERRKLGRASRGLATAAVLKTAEGQPL